MASAKNNILVLNGPNINMLGTREPKIYGKTTLKDIEALCVKEGAALGLNVECIQSNHEGELVTIIQQAKDNFGGIVFNAGAYTHTSVAIHDALKAVGIPFIEVHISNVFARESFRHHSFLSPIASGIICGLGVSGYVLGLRALKDVIL